MNLNTNYLGLELKSPLIVGASPLGDKIETVRELQEAGAGAVILHSLFEEQIEMEERAVDAHVSRHSESFAEALSYFPSLSRAEDLPGHYIRHLSQLREAVTIPIIASLNGTTPGSWTRRARQLEDSGASAIELNLYRLVTDPTESASDAENRAIEIVHQVRAATRLPLSVKLSPFFTALPHFASALCHAGADGLVLFNRFYQPDIDLEQLEAVPRLNLSTSVELLLRIRWIAILRQSMEGRWLSATGGVHSAADCIKAIMAGADTVQIVSALLLNGAAHLARLHGEIRDWMKEHEYEGLDQMRGSMSHARCPDPAAFERGNYLRVLQGWQH